MSRHVVHFEYRTGLKREIFRNAVLHGSWDSTGRYSDTWTSEPMDRVLGPDGCPTFTASVEFDTAERSRTFRWGVALDGPQGAHFWGVPTELPDVNSVERYRTFVLDPSRKQVERYYLTYGRRLGANKHFRDDSGRPTLRFAVWAPNARAVDVVFGDASGYIADDGSGIDTARPVVPLEMVGDGVWEGGPAGDYGQFLSLPYMYRVVNAQGETVYRTDIFSRSQAGRGNHNPRGGPWHGDVGGLDGSVSCSVVIDPDVVRPTFESTPPGAAPSLVAAHEFWAAEYTPGLPVPTREKDMVIYELHVGSLGFGTDGPGTLGDAVGLLDHLVELGVNAVELLPMAEFSGNLSWGYGDTHHFCIESSAGGRDKYRHFVWECHRRGMAVLQDVVYNHYDPNADRAQWQYDSTAHEQNIYYWYEGRSSDHAEPTGGYLDNGSTGWAPRYWEEVVRQQFISSAAFLLEEMHVDGIRVDLTQAIHRDNALHQDGTLVSAANVFGQKLLREWSRTLKMIKPNAVLIAEDHTGWDAVTKPAAQGGLGFDLTWAVGFYHHLIGDAEGAGDRARLLKRAGLGTDEPLGVAQFAGALYATQGRQVVFHESHDEAGNAEGTHRTLVTAVNDAPLVGDTRAAAEARARVCAGLSLLSAATPMFFMAEEVGAQKAYRYNDFIHHREDIHGDREGQGRLLYRFYQDLLTLRRRLPALRSDNIDILHVSDTNRVIAFKRWEASQEVIVVASLANTDFPAGYVIAKDNLAIPNGFWKEVLNSDGAAYGGANQGNGGANVQSTNARLELVLPANGLLVLVKQ